MSGAYIGFNSKLSSYAHVEAEVDSSLVPGFPVENIFTRQLSEACRVQDDDIVGGVINPELIVTAFTSYVNLIVVIASQPCVRAKCKGTILGVYSPGQVYTAPKIIDQNIDLPFVSVFPIQLQDLNEMILQFDCFYGINFVDVQRVMLYDAINLDLGVDGNWSMGADDSGTLDDSDGQQWYENKGVRTRRLNVSVSNMNSEKAFGFGLVSGDEVPTGRPSFQELQIMAGKTGDVYVVPRTNSGIAIRRLGVYGHLANVPTISHQAGDNFTTSFTVIEER